MLRLTVIGALMWALLGLVLVMMCGCAPLPKPEHHDSNIHAQPPFTILEA